MNRFFTAVAIALNLSCIGSLTAASDTYVNNGIASMGDQSPIDATNVVNNGQFWVTNDFLTLPYYMYDTLNITNRNLMVSSIGFQFDNTPGTGGAPRMANNFVNANLVNDTNCLVYGGALLTVSATNIINRGTLEVGTEGVLSLTGGSADLSRGAMRVDGFGTTNIFFNGSAMGIFDQYWGMDPSNAIFSSFVFNNGFQTSVEDATSFSEVTNVMSRAYVRGTADMFFSSPSTYVYRTFDNTNAPTKEYHTVVMVNNTNSTVSIDVRFDTSGRFPRPVVQWSGIVSNAAATVSVTNLLYLTDTFSGTTNINIVTNRGLLASYTSTRRPYNYTFSWNDPFAGRFVGTNGIFTNFFFTNSFYGLAASNTAVDFSDLDFGDGSSSAWGGQILPTSYDLSLAPLGACQSNQTGRLEIRSGNLSLNKTRIEALNYMLLKATNHFGGSTNAYVTVPYCDINLASTNSVLQVTNLLSSYMPRLNGQIRLWSARATNEVPFGTNTITNYYQVLMVDSSLDAKYASKVGDLTLRATNVVLSDVMNVQSNLLINAKALTLTTNVFAAVGGELNLQTLNLQLGDRFPQLQYLTNSGRISALNDIHFGVSQPLAAFVNRGSIACEGNSYNTAIFENTGSVVSRSGGFSLQSSTASLTNGSIQADNSDITVQSAQLLSSGQTLLAGRSLNLSISSSISDAGVAQSWSCRDGFNLLVAPSSGDLFATTVTNTAFDNVDVINTWAAVDKGASPSSFTNSTTIGHLILDGGNGSQFTFVGTSTGNALYIDHLELKNYATNAGSLNIDPNFRIYVGSASPVSPEKLSILYPQITWVSDFNGPNSVTNIVLRNGQPLTVNSSLITSSTVDSDGDGIPNAVDPYPFDGLQTSATPNLAQQKVAISWYADSANWQYYIDYSSDLKTWTTLATVTSGPVAGQQVSYQDLLSAGAKQFYRVRTLSH